MRVLLVLRAHRSFCSVFLIGVSTYVVTEQYVVSYNLRTCSVEIDTPFCDISGWSMWWNGPELQCVLFV